MAFAASTFDQINFDTQYYALTENSEKANFIFLPYNYWSLEKDEPQLITAYAHEARKLRKPLLIDAVSDKIGKIPISNSVALRYSYYRSKLKKSDIVIPVYAEDLLASYRNGILTMRDKKELPTVGFAGWSSLPFFTYPKTYIKDLPLFLLGFLTPQFDLYRKGVLLRRKALKILEQSPLIETRFLYRKSFSGNIKTAEKNTDILREEFVENIINSDYTLCIRGDANQSTRFFETLSLGRIPIFVDTDMALPLTDIINYRDFCVFVDYRELKNIDKIIHEFHRSVSPEKFKHMQKQARETYEKYLRIDSYTPFLMEKLRQLASSKHANE
ncbi:exostosin family protein [Candidatus Kaiserbacteria bacterium]|nr:exostosin family protein [Candidatus Kaiserbacteria bacterium]